MCIYPGNASAASEAVHGDTLVAQPPVSPEHFLDRGASMDDPAGKRRGHGIPNRKHVHSKKEQEEIRT